MRDYGGLKATEQAAKMNTLKRPHAASDTSEEEELPDDYTSNSDENMEDTDSEDEDATDSSDDDESEEDGDSGKEVNDNDPDGDTGIDSISEVDEEELNSAVNQDSSVASKAVNEYAEDSSDEEDIKNTVGNIPLEWYKEYDHLGYDVRGNKIIKPQQGDGIDEFLNKMEDPDYWRTVTDKWTGEKTVLSKEDVELIKKLQKGGNPSASEEMYPEWIDFFSGEEMMHPVTNRPMDKRSFIPSKWERLKVGKMVHAIKMGWMKPRQQKTPEEEEEDKRKRYDLWSDEAEDGILRRYRQHIPAPKLPLPGHVESYNPPPEYLLTKEEEEKWTEQEPEERRINFLPQKYSCMRLVPAYSKFINERFERCLDLYLCARQRKMKMNVNPEDLIPKLPKPKDLQPFPTTQALVYKGHEDMVRCICPDPSGQWLVSGSDDGTVRFWEVATARCLKTVEVSSRVTCVAWNPNEKHCLVAVSVGTTVMIINPGLGDKKMVSDTDAMLLSYQNEAGSSSEKELPVDWVQSDLNVKDYKTGVRLRIEHPKEVAQVTWHDFGDFFATVMHEGQRQAVLVHRLTTRHSQSPFSKSKGWVQCVKFHQRRTGGGKTMTMLYVATQRFVRQNSVIICCVFPRLKGLCGRTV
ncbi:ribosome biogenesis protein bop1-like isoform X2 [Littorina saxatilis]|uniref:ribosome biogenesis protein bop1-like isoform X2 n=1 Tax=Littorina saxatilis TaxID=31220 RepID=UPI0038B6923A